MRLLFTIPLFLLIASSNAQTVKRNIIPSDYYRLQTIGDPQPSADGNWIAYTLSSIDSAKDKRSTDLYMISNDGKQTVQLTNNIERVSMPRWSPDGKYISFLASRSGSSSQIWLLDRRGGEAIKLTDVKGELETYNWSPDSKKIAMILKDTLDSGKNKIPKPYIIDRYHFKQDVSGYQYDTRNSHLYTYDVSTKKLDTLTKGKHNENDPQWSPDSQSIAFVSNQTDDEDRNNNSDIWIIESKTGSLPKRLTSWTGSDISPRWSPDGKSIAYLRSTGDGEYLMYDQEILCVANVKTGESKLFSKALDRPVSHPVWGKDNKDIGVLVEDDIEHYIGEYNIASGKMQKIIGGERNFITLLNGNNGSWLTMMSKPDLPAELYVVENSNLRRLTFIQDKFIEPLQLGTVSKFVSKSKDGTNISNLLVLPSHASNQKLPLVMYIHGGPVAQDDYGFDLTRQMIAARGYAVAGVNYRGSNGRGMEFTKAIFADWGNKEVMDILGAVDHLIAQGIADPQRLAMSGWSYGGILTNFTIASDNRFKAAISGAGSAMQLSLYGVDQYILQFDKELGQPWKDNNLDKYLKLSYPFLHADRIKTPTLFVAGEKDFNVPAIGSEQMYQALRSIGIPTQLLIYPGQFHGFTQPSYIVDRFNRYYNWLDKYLK